MKSLVLFFALCGVVEAQAPGTYRTYQFRTWGRWPTYGVYQVTPYSINGRAYVPDAKGNYRTQTFKIQPAPPYYYPVR